MRLIDADKLEELCDIMAEKCGSSGESIWNQFRTMVECSPTVDAVEVVRCKDCEFFSDTGAFTGRCDVRGDHIFTNDFCSYAVWRNDDRC